MQKKWFVRAIAFLAAFAVWTVMVCLIDVQPIGPMETSVGLAGINGYIHRITGVNWALYTITDDLSLVPVSICVWFAVLGLVQWIKRKKISKVDADILALGAFYVLVMGMYVLFECCVVNYRPVLVEGALEASYPSSTTMLVLCVMSTACMQGKRRIRHDKMQRMISTMIIAFSVFMVAGRAFSGVHWFSDIVGGILLSAGLTAMYCASVKTMIQ